MNIRSDIDSTENVGDKKNINLLSFAPKWLSLYHE
jgi:hypothetical protein